jgi:phage repressor protein C with HTH and peptisase S24 domain
VYDLVAISRRKDEAAVERLIQATGGRSVAALANVLGVSHQAIYNARNKGVIPKGWYIDVAQATGVSVDWLLSGRGSRGLPEETSDCHARLGDSPRAEAQSTRGQLAPPPDFLAVPQVQARLVNSAPAQCERPDRSAGRLAFLGAWLRAMGEPEKMALMNVSGHHMAPTICDGDTVLLDLSQQEAAPGRIYAIALNDLVIIRRIDVRPGHLVLSADSGSASLEIPAKDARQAPIVGRVVWWCREAR